MNIKLDTIEHPAHPESYLPPSQEVRRALRDDLVERYRGQWRVDVDCLAAEVFDQVGSLNEKSARREQENVVHVFGTDLPYGEDADLYYREYSGNPEKFGEFLAWFGHMARVAFESTRKTRHEGRLGLKLADKSQYGLWKAGDIVDDHVAEIAVQVSDLGGTVARKEGEESTATSYSYLFVDSHLGNPSIGSMGVIRRRSQRLDVTLPDLPILHVFDERYALHVPRYGSEVVRRLVSPLGRAHNPLEPKYLKNGLAHTVGAMVFEKALAASEHQTHDLIPLGAQLIMTARNPHLHGAA